MFLLKHWKWLSALPNSLTILGSYVMYFTALLTSKRIAEDRMWLTWRPWWLVQMNSCQRFGEKIPLLGFSAKKPGLEARQFRVQGLRMNSLSDECQLTWPCVSLTWQQEPPEGPGTWGTEQKAAHAQSCQFWWGEKRKKKGDVHPRE